MSRKDLVEDLYPLSPTQQGLLFHALYSPRSGQYIEQLSCTLRGDLDREAFQGAWERVVQRHPALRTVFLWEKRDEPVQVVYRRVRLRWREEDWRDLAPAAREARFQALVEEEQETGFDLTRPPLMRLSLLRVEERAWRFLWTHHHLLLDGWSLPMVVQEVFRAYAALARREEPALPPARPYGVFLDWLAKQDLGEAEGFWRRALAGFRAPTPLGVDRSAAGTGFEEEWTELEIAPLQDFARRHRLTLGTMIQGAWAALLARYSGEEDVLFGLTVSGRPSDLPGVESIVGLFINTLPARAAVPADAPLVPWLAALQERQSELLRFSHTPLADAQRWSEVPRGTPLFETILVVENYPVSVGSGGGLSGDSHLAVEDVRAAERTHYPVTVTAIPGRALRLSVSWDRSRLDGEAARRLLGHFRTLLQAMPSHADRRVGDLPLLTADEERLLREWNPPAVDWPGEAPVHELFAARVREAPGAVAVVHGGERVTYGELARAAERVARALLDLGVGREDRVGVMMQRSPRALAAILGTLRAGAAYVPLDPSYASRRLSLLVEDSDLRVLLTEGAVAEGMATRARVLRIEDLPETHRDVPSVPVDLDALAYVIYTSGSTGRPKGVMVSHRSLANAFLAWEEAYRLRADTTAHLQMASLSFDVFTGDMARALASGGRLVICPRDLLLSPGDLLALAEREAVDAAEFVPAVIRQVVDHLEEHGGDLSRLRLLAVGSDAWYGADLNRLLRLRGPRTRLVNSYGVTEATIDSSWYESGGELPGDAPVPIGRPFASSSLHVVDRGLRPVPVGVAGELVLGGRGLARGYFVRPDLTAERFVPDPFGGEPGARLYRTGDLARRRPDGTLELLGRADHQVKVRGHRIEPGEVEAALGEHPGVGRCAVVARRDGGTENRLVAYVVGKPGAEPAAPDLRRFLAERLPEPMVPAAFVLLDELPLTPNGKIDRGGLPAPGAADLAPAAPPAAPRDPVEEELARVWAEVLRVERVGIHDDFFDLGGDSILSIQVVSRAQRAGLRITPRQVFESPTVAGLAALVRAAEAAGAAAAPPVLPAAGAGRVPLTPIQRWFFAEGFAEPHHWNQALLLESSRPLDPAVLETAVRGLEARHDALRLRFRQGPEGWSQRVEPAGGPSPFVFVDLSDLPEARRLAALESAAAALQGSLDLEAGPLCRFALLRPGQGAPDRLLAAVHHLAVDGVSWGILLQDLAAPSQAPTTPFAAWARGLAAAADDSLALFAAEAPVWLAAPRDVPALPLDTPGREANTVASQRTLSVELDAEDTRALLQEVHRATRARIDEILLAALALAFRRWTGGGPLLVDLEGHGREEELVPGADLSHTVGWFTSVAPVWLGAWPDEAGDPAQALREAKERLRSLPRRGIGYGLLRWLGGDEIAARLADLPRPEVSFNYLGQVDRTVPEGSSFRLAAESPGPMMSPRGRRSYLIEVNALAAGGRLRADWTYSAALHREETVRALAEGFAEALRELIGVARQAGASGARVLVPSDFPLARLDGPALERLAAAGPVEDAYPLSPMQEGMLFHSLYAPRSGVYVEHLSFTVAGGLDLAAFRGAWQDALDRHPILRSAFLWEGLAEPLQVVRPGVAVPWRELDWSGLGEEERRRRLAGLLAEDRRQGFDLSRAPLLRLTAIREGDDRHRFVWCHHHVLLDGWSIPLLLEDVLATYQSRTEARVADASPRLPSRRPYRDYIAWLRGRDLTLEAEHWREALRGLEGPTPLGIDRPAGEEDAPDLAERRERLDEARTAALQAFARRHRLTLNTLLQGAWALLLGRYAGEEDVLYGCTVSGRPPELAGSETMIGLFINTLPVRVRMPAGRALLPWLAELQGILADLRQHEHAPLVEIQRWAGWPAGRPLFESAFVFENYPGGESPPAAEGARVLEVSSSEGTNFPLTLAAAPGARLVLTVSYDRRRFDDPALVRLAGHLRTLLDGMAADPERSLDEIPVLSEAERAALVLEWNDSAAGSFDVCAHQMFEEQARLRPEAPAVEMGDRVLSYRELDRLAEGIAGRLRQAGVRPGSRVALCAGRTPEAVAGLLGILKAGGAFVPLDPLYPEERLAFMLDDSGAETVLGESRYLDRFAGRACITLEEDGAPAASTPAITEPGLDDVAYIIYTSGSTGRPKGTALGHRGLANLVGFQRRLFGVGPGDRSLQFASLSFDASVWEIVPALGLGATLVLAPAESLLPGPALLGTLRGRRVTFATIPPSALAATSAEELPALRTLIAAAEPCPPEVVDRWAPGRRIFNGYGPTEATVCSNVARCEPGVGRPPVGRPTSNARVYLLDRLGRLAPLGAPGEIAIGGVGLAHGYVGQPGLTAERFIPDPFAAGGRLYRTGDLGRQRSDGAFELLGRIDHQLKVRGHRVEAGEVEAALASHPQVREAAVTLWRRAADDHRLAAYVSLHSELPTPALAAFLRERLPAHMVPSAFVVLPELPRLPNGKLDRRSLPAPDARASGSALSAPPRTPLEEEIAGVWREVLGLERVGVEDNFFDLGGHSLLVVRVHGRLRALGRDVEVVDLFHHPTVAALAAHLGDGREEPRTARRPRPVWGAEAPDIAVVGLACRFPGAADPDAFWRNLRDGVESISFFSPEELADAGVPAALMADPGYVPAKAVLDGIDRFDAAFFNITPRDAERMDPQHRVFLEVCWGALESAGCDPSRFPGPIGVYAGETLSTYLFHLASDPGIGRSVASMQNMIGLDREFLTTTVSYKLDLRGPSFTLQTACSTSLVAVCVACQSLRSGECDMALAGGVSIRVPAKTGYLYQDGGVGSPDGHCRAFDAGARGTVGGDGAGVVLLKRLDDARRDGDPIRAVIRGWALNNDGSAKVGYTAPSVAGQAEAIAAAQELAGVDPGTITFVEGHGTGTPLGDPIEVAALTRVFRESTARRGFCALGAVKSNFGHLDAAAGVAGLIKTVLALEHGEIPPTVHFQRPNPATKLEGSPFFVNSTAIPWRPDGFPRRAGVSSFGVGGTNAHVVLEEAPVVLETEAGRSWQLFPLSARGPEALETAAANLARWMEAHSSAPAADVAWTLQAGRKAFPVRRVLVARGLEEAARRLSRGEGFTSLASDRRPAFFLLPGNGVQRAGMGRGLYGEEPAFRERIDRCAEALRPRLGIDLRAVLDPPAGGEAEAERLIARSDVGHPALFALEYALAGLWMDWGVRPAALLGHSLGEWVAACLAGVFSPEDALGLLCERGRLVDAAPAGAMLSVPLPETDLLPFLTGGLELSGVNAPALCSVAGSVEAVERLRLELEERGVLCRRIEVARAYHSAAMEPVARELARLVAGVERRPPSLPYLSNLTGTWIRPDQAVDPAYWAAQVRSPVRFADGMAELLRSGDGALLEIGPGGTLGAQARRQPELLGDRPVLASLPRPREGASEEPEPVSLLTALGRFWAAGGEVDWEGFQAGRRRARLPLPTYPFERRRYWVDVARPAALSSSRLPESPEETREAAVDIRPSLGRPWVAPRTAAERRVAEIWTQVLGIGGIGVDDDFHELGGDSLRGLDLLARVRAAFGVELPLRALLEASTVARLAAVLGESVGSAAALPGGLVTIQEGDGRVPVFLVHPAGGHVLGYRPLAERLGAGRPVYGLEARGTRPGEVPCETIEEMAADHLAAVTALRPRGPYILGGASMGGTVAWEMARQLRERGERVDLVALFDTPGPGQMPREPEDDAEVLAYLGGARLGLSAEDLRRLPPAERLPRALEQAAAAGLIPPGVDRERAAVLVELFRVHLRAMLSYRPGPYAGRVAFFRAAERRPSDPPYPEVGWIGLAEQGAEVHVVPGDHGTMYLPPHVDTLASRLRRCLEERE